MNWDFTDSFSKEITNAITGFILSTERFNCPSFSS